MSSKVVLYRIDHHNRARLLCDAMLSGMKIVGENVVIRDAHYYREREADVAVFYGFIGHLPRIMSDYSNGGSAVYIDLGYWGRHAGGRWAGYHKVSVNARHPTAYFQRNVHDKLRLKQFGITPQAWKVGRYILLAGMGNKGAVAEGFEYEEWERSAINEIRNYTDRPIIYRPKPSQKNAPEISGTIFSPPKENVEVRLEDCHAVVTHHSNVAVDGLVAGVPAFCWHGVASSMALQDLAKIEEPWQPDGRRQWMQDISYCQFNVEELQNGLAWRHLKNEGLVP